MLSISLYDKVSSAQQLCDASGGLGVPVYISPSFSGKQATADSDIHQVRSWEGIPRNYELPGNGWKNGKDLLFSLKQLNTVSWVQLRFRTLSRPGQPAKRKLWRKCAPLRTAPLGNSIRVLSHPMNALDCVAQSFRYPVVSSSQAFCIELRNSQKRANLGFQNDQQNTGWQSVLVFLFPWRILSCS